MDGEENQKQVSHAAHSPWKSAHRLELSRGKVESQQQASHFPTALRFPLGEQNEQKQKEASLAELRSFRLIVGL